MIKKLRNILLFLIILSSCKKDFVRIEYNNYDSNSISEYINNKSDSFSFKNQFMLKFIENENGIYSEFYGICPVNQEPEFKYVQDLDTLTIEYKKVNKYFDNEINIEESRHFKAIFSISLDKTPKIVLIKKM